MSDLTLLRDHKLSVPAFIAKIIGEAGAIKANPNGAADEIATVKASVQQAAHAFLKAHLGDNLVEHAAEAVADAAVSALTAALASAAGVIAKPQ